MDGSQIKHDLAMLYLKSHNISQLTPQQLSWAYDQIKQETYDADATIENRPKIKI